MNLFIASGSILYSTIKRTSGGNTTFLLTIDGGDNIWCIDKTNYEKIINSTHNIKVSIIGRYKTLKYNDNKTGKRVYRQGIIINEINFLDNYRYDFEDWHYGRNGVKEENIQNVFGETDRHLERNDVGEDLRGGEAKDIKD